MKTKICKKCKIEKEESEFYFRKDTNSYRNECKLCWSKETNKLKNEVYPWRTHFYALRRRCENSNASDYKWYGGKGIQCLITVEEIKYLWFRDRAFEMKKPTIDRKDSNKHYELSNCQFIEFDINRIKDRYKIVIQFDLKGNFIREFKSVQEAEFFTKIKKSNIGNVARDSRKTAGGFIWRYK